MNNIFEFIKDFSKKSGNYIFLATLISRLFSFGASWIAIQLIPNRELGAVIFAFQIISFILPISSLGLNQSLIRYGAQLKTIEHKNSLFLFVLKKGVVISSIVILALISCSFLINFKLPGTQFFLILLSTALLSHYFLEVVKIQLRLHKKNKQFAYLEFTFNFLLICLVFLLSWFFQELGYALAIIIAPILSSLLFFPKLNLEFQNTKSLKIINFKFWKYGFFASLSNVTTQLLISIDIILIGNLLNSLEDVTAFKYVSLIPFSFIFLSNAVITTDFVDFTEKINHKNHIKKYIKNYIQLFSIISISCIVFIILFGKIIIKLFDESYIEFYGSMVILTIGISGILLLRGLFGNLLSSLGKAHINFGITGISLLLNVILNYHLIPKYGILGAAITSAFLMWFTGVLAFFSFNYFFHKITFKE